MTALRNSLQHATTVLKMGPLFLRDKSTPSFNNKSISSHESFRHHSFFHKYYLKGLLFTFYFRGINYLTYFYKTQHILLSGDNKRGLLAKKLDMLNIIGGEKTQRTFSHKPRVLKTYRNDFFLGEEESLWTLRVCNPQQFHFVWEKKGSQSGARTYITGA